MAPGEAPWRADRLASVRPNPKIVSLGATYAAAGVSPNRAVFGDIFRALRAVPEFSAKYGLVDVEDLERKVLGKGHYAYAFALDDGMVLKITDDEADARVAQLVMREGNGRPGLPYIEGVYKLPGLVVEDETDVDVERSLYAIVMEPVTPAKKAFAAFRLNRRELGMAALADLDLAPWRIEGLPNDELREFVAEIRRGLDWLVRHGVEVYDLHDDNFGYASGGRPVLMDFGHDSIQEGFVMRPIPLAKNADRTPAERRRDVVAAKMAPIIGESLAHEAASGYVQGTMDAEGENPEVLEAFLRHRQRHAKTYKAKHLTDEKIAEAVEAVTGAKRIAPNVDQAGMMWHASPNANLRLSDSPLSVTSDREAAIAYLRGEPGWLYDVSFTRPLKIASEHVVLHAAASASDSDYEWAWQALEEMPELVPVLQRQGYEAAAFRDVSPENSMEHDALTIFRPISSGVVLRRVGGRVERNLKENGRSIPKARAVFDECFDIIERRFPDFGECELHQDEGAASDNGAGSERQFGYCAAGDPIVIAFASKIEGVPMKNIRGLMRHEFGHALDFRYGKALPKLLGRRLPDGAERRADAIAEGVFGEPIRYDDRLIQCVQCDGVSPRPRRLPK